MEDEEIFDRRSGEILEQELVQMARKEELDFMEKFGVCEDATNEECFAETGRAPVGTKWVDVNKGTAENPNKRCRLVARDFKPKGEKDLADLFASMPPLEAKKVLFSIAATHEKEFREGRRQRPKLMFIDVKKAHLNGRLGPDDVVFVQLPGSPQRTCSRLKRWLYGTREAASAWKRDFVKKLAEIGMMIGKSSPVIFHDPKTGVRAVVHGDDFTFLGFETELQQVKRELQRSYQLKVRAILGDDAKDEKTVVILNRKLV